MLHWACASACAFGLAAASVAAPVVKTGLSVTGALGDPATAGTPAWAYAQWADLVTTDSIRSEGFERTGTALTGETFQDSQPKLEFRPAASSGMTEATMQPSLPLPPSPPPPSPNPGVVIESASPIFGRFNTTPGVSPGHWWESTGDFTIAFDAPVSAFGLFITDSADFAGSLRILLDGANALEVVSNAGNTVGDGSLLFFGFADSSKSYGRITFDITQTTTTLIDYDVFGFDDLVIGTARNGNGNGNGNGTVPEPGTLALAGLSLLVLAAARRRRA
jgi:hypothetical protein